MDTNIEPIPSHLIHRERIAASSSVLNTQDNKRITVHWVRLRKLMKRLRIGWGITGSMVRFMGRLAAEIEFPGPVVQLEF